MHNKNMHPPAAPAWLGAQRSEGERSEPERRGASSQAGAEPQPGTRPNPEVVARAKRRRFTAEYKQRVLAEADAASEPGAVGALLRREGLFSSHLVYWRRERAEGIHQGLTPRKRGRKSKHHPLEEENRKLRRENQRLEEQLRKAGIVIEVQKKVAALLGQPIQTPDPEEES